MNKTVEIDKIEDIFSIILIGIFYKFLLKKRPNRKKKLKQIHELLRLTLKDYVSLERRKKTLRNEIHLIRSLIDVLKFNSTVEKKNLQITVAEINVLILKNQIL